MQIDPTGPVLKNLCSINEDNFGHLGLGDCGLCQTGFLNESKIPSFTNIFLGEV
jgi:hypothetical protein